MRSKKLSRSSMLAAAAGGSMLTATIAAESADDLKLPTGYRT
jgi:molybdopterin-binding protein